MSRMWPSIAFKTTFYQFQRPCLPMPLYANQYQIYSCLRFIYKGYRSIWPNFFYGLLSHADYPLALTLHMGNHQDDITVG